MFWLQAMRSNIHKSCNKCKGCNTSNPINTCFPREGVELGYASLATHARVATLVTQ
ncbi:hypothetical protein CURTO8I2_320027 [Curtobacterium sp. 8I-2]|nr:hypothetical protein CURTO8I2_320027 [Curtobacterium sp. 8I-2]